METQEKTTTRLLEWLTKDLYSKKDFCKMLGISRPTLDSRIKKGNWRKNEIDIIFKNCPF